MISKEQISKMIRMLQESRKPLMIIGGGVKRKVFKKLKKANMPYLLTWATKDYATDKEKDNFGIFGITGKRVNNIALKNADLILAIGTRLDTHEVMGNWRTGRLIMVDVDRNELRKQPADLKMWGDAEEITYPLVKEKFSGWLDWWRKLYMLEFNEKMETTFPYKFIDSLSYRADEKSIIITDAGQTLTWTMQKWKIKKGQRLFSAFNHSPMGYALPASIGAQFADPKKRVICITGDGGLQMNLQELQTIIGNNLPIKIFVLDNHGYGMIRQTQSDWPKFLKKGVACSPYTESLKNIARCFGFQYFELEEEKDFYLIEEILDSNWPTIIRVKILPDTKIYPKLKFGDELDDLTPKLTKNERKRIENIFKG